MSTHTFSTVRTLPHTPEQVYGAFADPAQLAQWWGPDGFANTFERFEFQPGGRWAFTMHGPDGTDYANENVFAALETDRRVVINHVCTPLFTLTVELTPVAGGTRLSWVQVLEDAAFAQAMRHIIEPANEQNINRLTQELNRVYLGQP